MAKNLVWLGDLAEELGAVLEMIVDELKTVPEVLGSDIGIWVELLGNENDEFAKSEGKLVGIVDEVDGGKSILGCKGSLGINESMDELGVVFIYDVTTYRDEFAASIIVVCN